MSSNINPYNIDGTFPVAGQDNPSQGFRDNFTNIKNNFVFAQSELNDLQSKALVTSALSGQTLNNDMAGTPILRPQLSAWTQALLDLGTIETNAVLDFNQGNFQKISTPQSGSGTIAVSFTNWPATVGAGALGYAQLRLWVNVLSTSYTITLPANINGATGVITGLADIAGVYIDTVDNTATISFATTGQYVFDFSSVDNGNSYLISEVTRNRSTLYGNVTVNGNLTVTGGVVDQGYQYLGAPATNFWANISPGRSRLIIDPASTLAAGNVTLPNVSVDGTIVSVHSTATITAFGANSAQSGTVVKPSASVTLTGGTGVDYFYHASENTWYKIR